MPDLRHPLLSRILALSLILSLGIFSGCNDATCVFAGNCFTGPEVAAGALGANAVEPIEGELILAGDPTVTGGAPSGLGRHSSTPVVMFFSETMAPDTVTSAFQIVDATTGFPQASTNTLLAAGRALIMFPVTALGQGDYEVELVDGALPTDLGGTAVDFDNSVDLPTFNVDSADPAKPEVVAVFPPDNSVNASSTTEILCIFDRLMSPPFNLMGGWDVMVRPAASMTLAAPMFDPDPVPIENPGFLGVPVPDPRVWVYQSTDGTDPMRLETAAGVVSVTISPLASSFTDLAVPAQFADQIQFSFTLSASPRPMVGMLNPGKQLNDAIGIANLDGITAANNLELEVAFEADDPAQDGDVLSIFMFGVDPADAANTIAFSRSVALTGAGIMSTTVSLAQLDLVTSTAPLVPRFADGEVRFAMRLERGADPGYLRLLDVDLVADGTQNPLLDTVRPEILLLDGQMTMADEFVSDQTDLVIVGHAEVETGDRIRGVEVITTGMGDNLGTDPVPPAIGSAPSLVSTAMGPVFSSFFIAAPVSIGRLAPTTAPFNAAVRVFDRALNASEVALTVPFRQRGAVGANPLDPNSATPLIVEVFDSTTLLPVAGAVVHSHAEVDDGLGNLSYMQLSGTGIITDANGVANTVPHHDGMAVPSQVATLVTVVAAGFDAFTFHGVPTESISIPLTPVQQVPGAEANSVVVDPGTNITTFARRVGDTRRNDLFFPSVPTLATPGGLQFNYNMTLIRPFRFGAQSFTAGIVDADLANAGKDRLMKAFDLRIPVDGQESAVAISMGAFFVSDLLDDVGAAVSGIAKTVPNAVIDASAIVGMDPQNLQDDGDYGRQPLVAVEATLAGVDRPLPVGMGTAYDMMGNPQAWDVRSAYAGAADPATGTLKDVLDSDLHLRVELREEDLGTMLPLATSGLRPELTQISTLSPLVMPNIPEVTSIATDGTGMLVSPGFDLTFRDEIDNASGLMLDGRGIYRVVITELLSGLPGRRWELYKLDAAGDTSNTVHFPDLGGTTPVPIQTGGVVSTVQVSSFAWESFPGFAPTESLMWTDIGREVESYAHTALVLFTLQ